jgi:integrase
MVEHDLYYGFHDLRHFMATFLSDTETVSLKTTSGLLRHKNLKTAEIYLHPVDESQRIATTKIEGTFTQKNGNPLTAPSHIKEKGVTDDK